MKLLSKQEAKSKIQKDNEELLTSNSRLRKINSEWIAKINNIKVNYSKDKEVKEYENFCAEILIKKSNLLKEIKSLDESIETKKEIIYSLIEKQDSLIEKEYQLGEREKKLDLREDFIRNVENKVYASNPIR